MFGYFIWVKFVLMIELFVLLLLNAICSELPIAGTKFIKEIDKFKNNKINTKFLKTLKREVIVTIKQIVIIKART